MKKALGILLLLLVGIPAGALLEGCTEDEGCQVEEQKEFFEIQGMAFNAVRTSTNRYVATNEAITTADLRLEVRPSIRYYSLQLPRAGWMPAAHACPPMPISGYGGTTEVLDSLEVRSLYAFDSNHPAGSSLNDLLIQRDGQPLPLVPARGTAPAMSGSLQFRQGPAQVGFQQFVLRYRLTNGESYVARTPRLILQ